VSLISYVTKIHFADHVLEHALEAELEDMAVRRPLILWDGDEGRADVRARLECALSRGVKPKILPLNDEGATEEACDLAAFNYQDESCDGIIAMGGATAIHLAKAVAIRVSHPGPLQDYLDCEGGLARIRNLLPPLIAIPTSAGTGTEASDTAIISLPERKCAALTSPFLIPRVVICDPTLTLDLGGRATASAGMEALTTCVETYISSAFNPPADALAADGIRRIFRNLERALADGRDLDVRRELMAAALNGSLAQQKGLGALQAMSNALLSTGGRQVDKGAICAILLPAVLAFNAPAASARYGDIHHLLALPPSSSLADAVITLREKIGLPPRLSELGVQEEDLATAAVLAARDHANRTNPRKAGAEDYLKMLKAAL
jgi:4-hydroxybutyrate dehydrogenase